MVFCYAPIILIDVVGLMNLYMKTQLYINMFETAVMIIISIILSIIEFCKLKKLLGDDVGYKQVVSDSVMNASMPDDNLMAERKLREDMLKSIMNQIKGNRDLFLNNKLDELLEQFGDRKCKSMIDFGSDKEEDDRNIRSFPLTPKTKKQYEGPFTFDYLPREDNVYAESKPPNPLGKIGKEYSDADIQTLAPRGVPKNGGNLPTLDDNDDYE